MIDVLVGEEAMNRAVISSKRVCAHSHFLTGKLCLERK